MTFATEAVRGTGTSTRLTGPLLSAARVAWVVIALIYITAWIASIEPFYQMYKTVTGIVVQGGGGSLPHDPAAYRAAMRMLNVTPEFVAQWLVLPIGLLAPLPWFVVAIALFWRRSNEWLSLLTSLMLIMFSVGGVTQSPAALHAANLIPAYAYTLLHNMAWLSFFVFVYIFPNGRFVPRWTLWFSLATFVFYVLVDYTALPAYIQLPYYTLEWGTLVVSQVYRYRRAATPAERQQIKWLMYAVAFFAAITIVVYFIPVAILGARSDDPRLVIIELVFFVLYGASSALIPLAIGASIVRYRLWDIDFVINRSLAAGAATLILGGVFAGLFFGLQAVLQALLGSGQIALAAVVSTAAVLLLFNPARKFLQRQIDQRFYGIKLDYVEAVKAYGGTKRAARKTGDTKDTFGSYTGLSLIGRGGMGEVYLSQHPTLNRAVAIKILPAHIAGKTDAEKRFMREAQTIAKLKHPNIITLHDVGEQDGKPYMVMEYIDGTDLAEMLHERGRLPLDEALPILHDVAAALDYAHENGVIHRDIKPSNVMIEKVTDPTQARPASFSLPLQGEGRGGVRAVLMDFGIAKSYAAGTKLTQTGMIGTLDYISPEQIQGASEVDARADVYSFGVMAYQVLTGQLPFIHNNPGAMVLAHITQPAPDPRELVKDLPDTVANAVMRAMAKKPEQRFASAGEFVAAMA